MKEGKPLEELNNTDYDEKKLEKLLLMPIVCRKRNKSIEIKDEVIYTGQVFYTSPDEDMSDIAIDFYEILYSKALNGTKILTKQDITNCCFAGDTMNSFNTIANLLKRKNKELSTDEENLLRAYEKRYHCLANFWILPSCIGRRGRKGNNLDSMDIFLNSLEQDYDGVMKKHQSFYTAWGNISSFRTDHFLDRYVEKDTDSVRKLYAYKDAKKIIDEAIKRIEIRAEDISKSDIGKELWRYFCKHNLV